MSVKLEISKRIEEFFLKTGLQKNQFAEEYLSIQPQNLNKVFKGKLDPLKFIDILVKKVPTGIGY